MVGKGKQGAIAAGQHALACLGQCHEAVAGNVVGNLEALAGGHIHKITVQFCSWGETYCVNDTVQAIPLFAQFGKDGVNGLVAGHIAREAHGLAAAVAFCSFKNAAFQFVVLVSESQLGTLAVHGFGNTGGNGAVAETLSGAQRCTPCETNYFAFPR